MKKTMEVLSERKIPERIMKATLNAGKIVSGIKLDKATVNLILMTEMASDDGLSEKMFEAMTEDITDELFEKVSADLQEVKDEEPEDEAMKIEIKTQAVDGDGLKEFLDSILKAITK